MVIQIQIVQPTANAGDEKDSESWVPNLVAVLTALGAFLAGVGALAALLRRGASGTNPSPSPSKSSTPSASETKTETGST